MRRLRAWKTLKKEKEQEKFLKEVREYSVSLDENTVKIMILKLMQVERLMKDMGKSSRKFTDRIDKYLVQDRGSENLSRAGSRKFSFKRPRKFETESRTYS